VDRRLILREIFLHPLAMFLLFFVYVHVAFRVSGRLSLRRLAKRFPDEAPTEATRLTTGDPQPFVVSLTRII